jgi:hypothetical protein
LWRAARRFMVACARLGGLRSGWTGVQIAMLEGVFAWVEEAKLRQLANEFHRANSREDSSATDTQESSNNQTASTALRAKAA